MHSSPKVYLDVESPFLEGTIPTEIGQLTGLGESQTAVHGKWFRIPLTLSV